MPVGAKASNGGLFDTLEVLCPADGRTVARWATDDPGQVGQKAPALRSAQAEWEGIGPRARGGSPLAWLDWIMDNENRLTELIQSETGKSWGGAAFEPSTSGGHRGVRCPQRAEMDGRLTPPSPQPGIRIGASENSVASLPLAGVILPWNMPLGMPMFDIPFAIVGRRCGSLQAFGSNSVGLVGGRARLAGRHLKISCIGRWHRRSAIGPDSQSNDNMFDELQR